MNNSEMFLDSLMQSKTSSNTIKVVNSVMLLSSKWNELPTYNVIQLEEMILDMKPNSPKAIVTISYVIGLYAKWLYDNGYVKDDSLYQMVISLDKSLLWLKAKPNATKKFISHKDFLSVIHDVEMFEEYNSLYYTTLFQSIYEGIYNDDMSVIKNLRASDINGCTITLREDNGHVYNIDVTNDLADKLIELSSISVWERNNRYGTMQIKISGDYPDIVFKREIRNGQDDTIRFSYYNKLRKISKGYLEYNLLPLQLYISGIMYRIRLNLEKHNITLEEAFVMENRNRLVGQIISKELERCNCTTVIRNFREMVRGHIEVFTE